MVVVCKALDFFKRDEDIDEFETKKIATVMDDGEEGQVYENDEVALLDRVQEALLKTSALKFQNVVKDKEERDGIVWSKTNDRKMKNAVLRAVFVVDGTVEMCAAWEWNKGSRKRKKKACKICLHREVVELDEHTQLFRVITDPKTSGFRPREWVVKGVWRSERGGGVLVVYEDVDEPKRWPLDKAFVRVKCKYLWKFDRLEGLANGLPQTRVSYSEQVDLKGYHVHASLASRHERHQMANSIGLDFGDLIVGFMKEDLEQRLKADEATRSAIAKDLKEQRVGGTGGEMRRRERGRSLA